VGCFDRTAPYRLNAEEIYSPETGGLAFMQYLRDLRDAFAAHRFGPLRQSHVGVLMPGDGTIGLRYFDRLTFPPPDNAEGIRFIGAALQHVEAKLAAATAQLEEVVQELDPDAVDKLPELLVPDVGVGDIRMTRKAFLKKHKP